MWSFVQHDFVLSGEAVLPVTDLSIQRGYGVFDFFRTKNGQPLFLEDHLRRLERSAATLRLTLPYTIPMIKDLVYELISKNGLSSSGIRITVTGGPSMDFYTVSAPSLIITEQPIEMSDQMQEGMRLVTHEHCRELPEVKSINYLTGIFLRERILRAGADDVLYISDGNVLELPRANMFIVTHDRRLATPLEGVLEGVTRKRIISLAQDLLPVEIRPVRLSELYTATAVFISSTTKRVHPVVKLDGKDIGISDGRAIINELYQRLLAAESV